MNNTHEYVSFTGVNRTLSDAIAIYEQRVADSLEVYSKYSDQFVQRSCPVCGGESAQEIDKFHGCYGITQCNQCASTFVNPSPSLEALEYYYNDCACNEMLGKVYRERATKTFIMSERVVDIIGIIKKTLDAQESDALIKILEVGCSSGVFLSELKQGLVAEGMFERCELQGVDIDLNAVEMSVDSDLKLIGSSVEVFAENEASHFDLILHFELIEHITDPFGFMVAVHKMLKPGGTHYFHTPNILGMDNVALGWNSSRLLAHGIFPPMHINAFTTHNITHFALRSGFNVVSIDTPGKLDVDIVRLMADEIGDESIFTEISKFSNEQLAIIQGWLRLLGASSHMRVTLSKC